jgi:hypothetical protein
MKTKITLIADEGKILTDGTHYGRIVYLIPDDDGSAWYEIPEEEYNAIMAAKYAETQGGERNA